MFSWVMRVEFPKESRRPPTCPCTPIPLEDSKLSAFSSARLLSFAARTIASAKGCSLPRSRLAARRRTSSGETPLTGMTCSNAGWPSVSVPVLSTMRVSISRIRSIAAASRKRIPWVAALPVATMMAIGVARPSAHGQAMMSTDTALMRPNSQPRSPPKNPQPKKLKSAMATTATTK